MSYQRDNVWHDGCCASGPGFWPGQEDILMLSRRTRAALLGATLLVTGGAAVAIAQATGSVYDPAQMPELHGKVRSYDLTPRGDVDGLILEDGTEVHFPPHLGLQVVAAVRPGETVTIHGLRARSLPLVQAMSVTGDASGKTVVDNGPPAPGQRPPAPPGPGQELRAQGEVRMQLHGPRGELNGVLLADGTMVHLPPSEASRLAAQLEPGDMVVVRGEGVEGALGRSIAARSIGPAEDKLAQVAAPPPPPHGPRHPGGPDAGRR
jgi:hypothetical protein